MALLSGGPVTYCEWQEVIGVTNSLNVELNIRSGQGNRSDITIGSKENIWAIGYTGAFKWDGKKWKGPHVDIQGIDTIGANSDGTVFALTTKIAAINHKINLLRKKVLNKPFKTEKEVERALTEFMEKGEKIKKIMQNKP